MSTFKDKLKRARLPERTVPICLRGDLVADFEAAEQELKQAQESAADSKEDGGVSAIIERLDALRNEMLEDTEQFRLRAIPDPTFHAFKAEFPPRRDDDGTLNATDAQLGLNVDTFFDALLRVSVRSPEMGIDIDDYLGAVLAGEHPALPDGDWPEIMQVLTNNQYVTLTDTAWFLNRGEVNVPFSSAASLAKRNSGGE